MFRAVAASLLVAFAALTGCSADVPAEDDESDEGALAAASCRPLSAVGQAVANATKSGVSTTTQVLTHKNRMTRGPIVGGEAYAEAMFELVRSAKREVIFEVFILEDGWLASRLRDAIATLDPAIPVYVLVTSDRIIGESDREGSGRVPRNAEEITADRVLNILDPNRRRNVIVGAWGLTGVIGTEINHDKAIVVDRSRAIVSNINLELPSDPSLRNPSGGQTWYQLAMSVEGEVAAAVAEEARTAWQHVLGAALSKQEGFVRKQVAEIRKMIPATLSGEPVAAPTTCLPIVALGREAGHGDEAAANRGLVALFTKAQRNVNVITPNLNAKTAVAALVDGTKQSDVYVVLSKGFTEALESLPGQGGGNEAVVDGVLPNVLAERGGNPCKMHVRYYAAAKGQSALWGEVEGASHTKFASADGQVVVLGSQNLDTQSWKASRELSLAVDDPATTAQWDAEFQNVWDRSECAFECGGCKK